MDNQDDDNHVEEPAGIYLSRKITFSETFSEMNEKDVAYYASLSPTECLLQLNRLLNQFYKSEFGPSKSLGKKIYFD